MKLILYTATILLLISSVRSEDTDAKSKRQTTVIEEQPTVHEWTGTPTVYKEEVVENVGPYTTQPVIEDIVVDEVYKPTYNAAPVMEEIEVIEEPYNPYGFFHKEQGTVVEDVKVVRRPQVYSSPMTYGAYPMMVEGFDMKPQQYSYELYDQKPTALVEEVVVDEVVQRPQVYHHEYRPGMTFEQVLKKVVTSPEVYHHRQPETVVKEVVETPKVVGLYQGQMPVTAQLLHGTLPAKYIRNKVPVQVSYVREGLKNPVRVEMTREAIKNPIDVEVVQQQQPIQVHVIKKERPISVQILKKERPVQLQVIKQERPASFQVYKEDKPVNIQLLQSQMPLRVNVMENTMAMSDVEMVSETLPPKVGYVKEQIIQTTNPIVHTRPVIEEHVEVVQPHRYVSEVPVVTEEVVTEEIVHTRPRPHYVEEVVTEEIVHRPRPHHYVEEVVTEELVHTRPRPHYVEEVVTEEVIHKRPHHYWQELPVGTTEEFVHTRPLHYVKERPIVTEEIVEEVMPTRPHYVHRQQVPIVSKETMKELMQSHPGAVVKKMPLRPKGVRPAVYPYRRYPYPMGLPPFQPLHTALYEDRRFALPSLRSLYPGMTRSNKPADTNKDRVTEVETEKTEVQPVVDTAEAKKSE